VIDRNASRRLRLRFAAAILFLIAATGFAAWMGLSTLLPALRGSAAGVPIIEFRPLYVSGLPLAVSFAALAILALLPARGVIATPRRAADRNAGAANILFAIAAAGVILCIVAAPLGRLGISNLMSARGYIACPPSENEHRPPMRWARPGVRCY
jgi:hypothetical protein